MRESTILHAVRAYMASQPDVLIWRCNGGIDLAKGVRYGLGIGAADLIGVLRIEGCCASNCSTRWHDGVGRFLALETKAPKGRPSPGQLLWGGAVQRAGGFYAIVRSVDQARNALERARAGAVS